ncbi:hypothetical protein R5W23_000908 [Gemmata sp. JC673]|uniref:Uncharacterized protein n=1 Tax=Gemmata algarum TaxID=2975278 RepID=A0ABU5EWY4_9BACT|nr:hypothetical protein [Gemmata algarum]MDY3559750.1 hypothetical protein [Gemmata algarum]
MHLTHAEHELELDLGPVTMSCTADELATALTALVREMRAAAPFIRPDERDALRAIMEHAGAPTVGEIFPDFARDSDAHTTLRKLRTAQFIRPQDRDRWAVQEHIEVKPFARLLWERLGEAHLFGDLSEPVEEIDLALPGVNDSEPPRDDKQKGKTNGEEWNEADVLDFLSNDDTKD